MVPYLYEVLIRLIEFLRPRSLDMTLTHSLGQSVNVMC